MNDLKDKTAIVSGGSDGIGLAIARKLSLKGAYVIICARNEDKLSIAIEKIRHEGVRFLSRVEIETSRPEDVTHSRDERKETLHHETASAFDNAQQNPVITNNQDTASNQTSGNRRLRRAEAKMARKNAKKKK